MVIFTVIYNGFVCKMGIISGKILDCKFDSEKSLLALAIDFKKSMNQAKAQILRFILSTPSSLQAKTHGIDFVSRLFSLKPQSL